MIENRKALITGINGQDGSYMTRLLLNKGYIVYGLTSNKPEGNNFENFKKLKIPTSAINKVKFDELKDIICDDLEIYNFAGQSSVGYSWQDPLKTFQVNVDLYLEILNLVKGKNIKVLQASSAEMYGDKSGEILTEKTDMNPNNPYALSKYSSHKYGQLMRQSEHMWITNTILFMHESPLRDSRFVTRKIIEGARAIKEKKQVSLELGNTNIERDFGFAEEYVVGMWKLLQLDRPMDVILATGKTILLDEFIKLVFDHFELHDYKNYIKIKNELNRVNDIRSMKADPSILNNLGIKLNPISKANLYKII